MIDAKVKLGRTDALELAAAASTVIVAKGKKVVRFNMRKEPPDEGTLLGHMLGPTGNLRAPTIRNWSNNSTISPLPLSMRWGVAVGEGSIS